MKKLSLILALLLSSITIQQSIAVPVYTDEIPQEYINKVKSQKQTSTYENRMMSNISDFDKESLIEVKVYSPENIRFKLKARQVSPFAYVTEATNIKIGDKFTFLVAEDVYKNNKLYIRKGALATGYVKKVNIPSGNNGPAPEFNISEFTTKDINNNTVRLKGAVINEYTGFIQIVSHAINKNKIYKLYCE